MRGSKRIGIIVACVCMLAAVNVSGAWAKGGLNLKHGGTAVAVGSPGDTGLVIGEPEIDEEGPGCSVVSNGTVNSNGKSSDVLKATSDAVTKCWEGWSSVSGVITETKISDKGTVALKAKIDLTEAGPCVYEFKKWEGNPATKEKLKFTLGKPLDSFGTAEGKLTKHQPATCVKTVTEPFFTDSSNAVEGAPFETELVS